MKIRLIFILSLLCSVGAFWFWLHPQVPTLVYEVARSSIKEWDQKEESSVFFLGDVMLARDVERRLKGRPVDYAFGELSFLKEALAVVSNFEAAVPVVHQPTPNMAMKFSVDIALLPVLLSGGVTHLSLANNHAIDYEEEGYANTVTELESREITTFGHPARVNQRSITYINTNEKVLAVIGINATYNHSSENWRATLAEASRHSDLQIAYIHWGEEYKLFHNEAQEELSHLLIDAGFELIIGHHPHVVQDIESYNGGLIFYSLGNFIFDQYWNDDVQEGLILELLVTSDEVTIILHLVESKTKRVRPRLMEAFEQSGFLEELAARSSRELSEAIRHGQLTLQF